MAKIVMERSTTNQLVKRFYYHYRHDPKKSIENFAFEVIGLANYPEAPNEEGNLLVIYRPLFEDKIFVSSGCLFYAVPRKQFVQYVEKGSRSTPRFSAIDDHQTATALQEISRSLYAG